MAKTPRRASSTKSKRATKTPRVTKKKVVKKTPKMFKWGFDGLNFSSGAAAKAFIKKHKLIVSHDREHMANTYVSVQGVPDNDGYVHYCYLEGKGIEFFEFVDDLRNTITWDGTKDEFPFEHS